MSNTHVTQTIDRTVEVEVPPRVLSEVALRTDGESGALEIRGLVLDHIKHDIQLITSDGERVVDVIQNTDWSS